MLVLIQVRMGQGTVLTLLLALVGGVGILTYMRVAPLLLLLLLALGAVLRRYFDFDFRWNPENQSGTAFRVSDLLAAAAVLGYCVGHYRLQSLHRHIFPLDYRLAAATWSGPQIERRRSLRTVTQLEQFLVILSLPAFALLGQLTWRWVVEPRNVLEYDSWIVRLTVLQLVVVGGVAIVGALLNTWRRRRMTLQQAQLMLQDTMWNDTRGEQRWLTRWLAWMWLKDRERKELP